MSYVAQHARTLDEALAMVASGNSNIISRIPLWDLMSRAALVVHGLFDFDGTLTPGSQWRAMGNLLPEDLRTIDLDNYLWYHSHIHDQDVDGVSLEDPDWWIGHLETGNKLAVDGAWIAGTFFMQQRAQVTRTDIRYAATTLAPRMGVAQLLGLMHQKAIVSFGIEQFIQDWLAHHKISAPVAASRLIFDDRDRVDHLHINVVGAGSKEFVANRFRNVAHTPKNGLMVVGDSVIDIHMMTQDSFNVLIIPPSELDRKMRDFRKNNLAAMWGKITMILADDSLEPLVAFLQEARESV